MPVAASHVQVFFLGLVERFSCVARATNPRTWVEESTAKCETTGGRWPQRIGHVVVCVSDITISITNKLLFWMKLNVGLFV